MARNVDNKMSYTDAFSGNHVSIGIAGIIGAGKSTLTNQLATLLDFTEFKEPVVTNPYLDLFYKDMKTHGFAMQVYLLNERFKHHQQMVWSDKSSVCDRTIYEDVIFAKMLYEAKLMSELDFNTYRSLFSNMANFLHRPDVIVYLDVTPEKALERIQKRGRECEKNLPVTYLTDLQKGYEDWLTDVGGKKDEKTGHHINGRIPVVRINWNEDDKPIDEIIETIKQHTKRSIITF